MWYFWQLGSFKGTVAYLASQANARQDAQFSFELQGSSEHHDLTAVEAEYCPLILPTAQVKFWYGLLPHCKCWRLAEWKSWRARRLCRRCWCRKICTKSKYSGVIWKVEIRSITSELEYRTWEDGVEAEGSKKVEIWVHPFQQNPRVLPTVFSEFFYRSLKTTKLGERVALEVPDYYRNSA